MRRALPRSRYLVGLIVGLEGLAIWVVAIFLASYQSTGGITWPGESMYATSVGTMAAWLASPAIGGFELLAYFGIVVFIAGPGWFWLIQTVRESTDDWKPPDFARLHTNPSQSYAHHDTDVDWIYAPESDSDEGTNSDSETPSWADAIFETGTSSMPTADSIEQRLAQGDFMRGSSSQEESTASDEEDEPEEEWIFKAESED